MKLIAWISSLSAAAKTIMSIVALITFLSGSVIGYRAYIISKYEKQVDQNDRNEQLSELQTSFNDFSQSFKSFERVIFDSLSSLSSSIQQTNSKLELNENILNNLKNHMINKSATKDDILDIMKVFDQNEKKKYGIGSLQTVLPPLNIETRLD